MNAFLTSWKRKLSFLSAIAVITFHFVTASDVFAQDVRECLKPAEITGRTCSEETCVALQDNVDRLCKTLIACNAVTDDCPDIKEKIQQAYQCIEARRTINATCWNGSNAGHHIQIANHLRYIENCKRKYAHMVKTGKCGPDPDCQ